MATASGPGLTPAGKIVVTLLVLVLAATGIYLMRDRIFPTGKQTGGTVDLAKLKQMDQGSGGSGAGLEAADLAGVTTVTEYSYVPAEKLPDVKGVSDYKNWDKSNQVVRFPINVWIGWLPIVAANHGFAPNTDSIFYKDYGFKVQLDLVDDPVKARDMYASGETHVLWGTLDMIALFAPQLMKDSRTAPRVFQQIDWSSGGDGIVVRGAIKTVGDLKGKTIAYAQNSPSQYYLTNLLLSAGIQPREVRANETATAFEAARAFVADTTNDACVSWSPDIYNITEKVPGTMLLSTTAQATKVIADVWAVRADFARDNPKVVKGLVTGIFRGMEQIEKDEAFKKQACKWLAEGYKIPATDVDKMLSDAHSTNFAENKQFFLNASNPTNFERTWNRISFVYQQLGKIESPVPYDKVMDFSVIKSLADSNAFAEQTDVYTTGFTPKDWSNIAEQPVVRETIQIHFYPNSANLFEPARDPDGKVIKDKLYDPSVKDTIERIGQLAGQWGRAVIMISGHADDSLRDRVSPEAVKKLSEDRAAAVRKALIDKFKFDENKFKAVGMGWDKPADPKDPHNHAKNRRVEIGVYPVEQE